MVIPKITPQSLCELKRQGEKVALLTAYDYPTALIEDSLGIEIILVGDSFGMTVLGYDSTLKVGMQEMLMACGAVGRAVKRAMIVADMPFMSYQSSNSAAIKNAGKFVASANADGVKVEGAGTTLERIKAIIGAGIPVMGHIGFTPQSLKKFGTYKVVGKIDTEEKQLIEDAKALEKVGVFSIIVECVSSKIIKEIKKAVKIPIYGIGAGADCDGQILVVNDILGLFQGKLPKYVKKYADLTPVIEKAIKEYISDVKNNKYPDEEHTYR
ncbi:MAG: 3-methyl-2-oxobutanoate hydroxymethyltransferase [bacterium]